MSTSYSSDLLRSTGTGSLPPLSPIRTLEQLPSPSTRYGRKGDAAMRFGTERRFRMQHSPSASDVMYNLPPTSSASTIRFGSSGRTSLTPKSESSTGPASYNVNTAHAASSEARAKPGVGFGVCPRKGLGLNTPSPGAVYNVDGVYKTGKDSRLGTSFNCDYRKPLIEDCATRNAEMYCLQAPRRSGITFGSRHALSSPAPRSPGAIYNNHEIVDFRTGPSFSFGHSKTNRFGPITT